MSDIASAAIDLREQIARIDRAQAEFNKFRAEQSEPTAEAAEPTAEAAKPRFSHPAARLGPGRHTRRHRRAHAFGPSRARQAFVTSARPRESLDLWLPAPLHPCGCPGQVMAS